MIQQFKPFLTYLKDILVFMKCSIKSPLLIGATVPSGKFLSKKMASLTNINHTMHVLELGPGTGPVTKALVKKGIPEENLILIEANIQFCKLLKEKFPKAWVIHGDALNLPLEAFKERNVSIGCVVSSLPLVFFKEEQRIDLIKNSLSIMNNHGKFIQFTYAYKSPIPFDPKLKANPSNRIWLNLWPAKVWQYSLI